MLPSFISWFKKKDYEIMLVKTHCYKNTIIINSLLDGRESIQIRHDLSQRRGTYKVCKQS